MDGEYQVQNIALKTLKQRCEYLQQRLDYLEEENCKLKLEKAQISNKTASRTSNGNAPEEQLIVLKKESSQMAHQIQMLTTENFNLWSQLSKIIPENEFTNYKLSFSPVTNSHQIFKFSQSENAMSSSNNATDDFSKESLEEISLKLINGILMGKNELENQYSQMIDLQRENSSEEIKLILPKPSDNRVLTKNIKEYVRKLKEFKQVLCQQKVDLTNAITVMKNVENLPGCGNFHCNRDAIHGSDINSNEGEVKLESEYPTLQEGKAANGEVSNTEMICPICGKGFTETETFTTFYYHVIYHFNYDEDEFVDASSNFDS